MTGDMQDQKRRDALVFGDVVDGGEVAVFGGIVRGPPTPLTVRPSRVCTCPAAFNEKEPLRV